MEEVKQQRAERQAANKAAGKDSTDVDFEIMVQEKKA